MTPIRLLQGLTAVPLDNATGCIVLHDCGRKQLRLWWKALGVKTGAEIGVWEGAFARSICEVTCSHLYAVDPWAPQAGYLEVKNKKARLHAAFDRATQALAPYKHTVLRMTSLEGATRIADRSLDWAYIDGNHMREHVLADIAAWTPKVKVGGILSGHDCKHYPTKPFIQVFDAVKDYTRDHAISPWFIFAADNSPSWAWVVA